MPDMSLGDRGQVQQWDSLATPETIPSERGRVRLLPRRNCLIVGPAGSGKLSLARILASVALPEARRFLFDWQVQEEAMSETLQRMRRLSAQGPVSRGEAWILRHLHRVPDPLWDTTMSVCLQACIPRNGNNGSAPRLLFATAIDTPAFTRRITETGVFPWSIRTDWYPWAPDSLRQVSLDILAELNERYGRDVETVEMAALEQLKERCADASLCDIRNILERAYIIEPSKTITSRSVFSVTDIGSRRLRPRD